MESKWFRTNRTLQNIKLNRKKKTADAAKKSKRNIQLWLKATDQVQEVYRQTHMIIEIKQQIITTN